MSASRSFHDSVRRLVAEPSLSLEQARQLRALRTVLLDANHPLHLQLEAIAELVVAVDRHDGGVA